MTIVGALRGGGERPGRLVAKGSAEVGTVWGQLSSPTTPNSACTCTSAVHRLQGSLPRRQFP